MGERNSPPLILTLFCVLGAVCLLESPFVRRAQTQEEALRRDFPLLSARYGEKPQKADYVIVLDRSGSMGGYWGDVKRGLYEFVDAVTVGDNVSIVTFGDVGEGSQDTPGGGCNHQLSARNWTISTQEVRSALQQELGRLCDPAGSSTDIGDGLKKTLDELYRPGGNTLKIVFFFSDFIHSPPAGSPYYGKFTGSEAAWRELAGRREKELADKKILSYAMLLNTGGGTGQHLNLARVVFPDIIAIPINGSTLRGELQRIRAEILRDKLKAIVRDEAARTKLSAGKIYIRNAELVAVLEEDKSSAGRGDLLTVGSVSNVRVENFRAGDLSGNLTLLPASDNTYSLNPATGQVEVPVATINDENFIRQEKSARVSFDLRATQNLLPAEEISKLGVQPSREFHLRFEPAESLIVLFGRYAWKGLIAAAVALLLVLALFRRRRRPEYIVGTFTMRDARNEPVGRYHFEKGQRHAQLLVGDLGDGRHNGRDVAVADADWLLQFEARRPDAVTKKKRGVYLSVKKGRATLRMGGLKNLLKRGDKERLLKPGAKVEAGGYTITFNSNGR